ncbi:hypothetical protein ACHHYP_15559 [Achlya hypogyna]|uniref:Hydrogen voltage-gated channel 1 n=1 Tax=Achlya hypogyna TaxID=1202772 RepID=A0A1V9YAL7_ACHHY|nr:hypothetical protein ACHHYP_15559 [Achlya hypogyna]
MAKEVSGATTFVPVTAGWDRQSIGALLESREMQVVMIALISLDVLTSLLGVYLDLGAALGGYATALAMAHRVLQSLSGFTLVVFLLELGVLVAVFQGAIFTHIGYCVDVGVVAWSLSWELQHQSTAMRALGVLRMWRVFRLVWTLIAEEAAKAEATAALLDTEKLRGQQLELLTRQLQDSIEKERAAKTQLNRTLQDYKDEIDTLKEALSIAAMAMAGRDADGWSDDDDGFRSPRATTNDADDEFLDATQDVLS